MRLIDADALPRHGNRSGLVNWYDIEKAPTVELIRCKDCKHNRDGICGWHYGTGYRWVVDDDDDFCSVAERKEE